MNANRWLTTVAWAVLGCLVCMSAGCGPRPVPRGIVKGHVTSAGKPVTRGTVFFENADSGIGLTAAIAEDGSYEVLSYQGAGLPPGNYMVAITPSVMMKDGEEIPLAGKAPPKPVKADLPFKILEKYHTTSSSGLTIEVKEGQNPPFDFEVGK